MVRKYRNYTDVDIINAVANVKSFAKLLNALGLKMAGGNYANMKRNLQRLNPDTSHWTGQGWSKGEQLKNWSDYARASAIKPHLINLRGRKCECCQRTKWQKIEIPLEIDHVDGDRTNNNLKNLRLLCPNCHALTPTWRRPKK